MTLCVGKKNYMKCNRWRCCIHNDITQLRIQESPGANLAGSDLDLELDLSLDYDVYEAAKIHQR